MFKQKIVSNTCGKCKHTWLGSKTENCPVCGTKNNILRLKPYQTK